MPMHDGGEYAEALRRIFERRGSAPPGPASTLGIVGTSRRDGNTAMLADAVFRRLPSSRLANLADYSVAPYDYDHRHGADDFIPLARVMAEAKSIVLATPVYWYAMSAQMKAFMDRLSDLTETHKPLGRALAARTVFVIATSTHGMPAYFDRPFAETAGYFDMRWGGVLHERFAEDRVMTPDLAMRANAFALHIKASEGRA